MRFLPPARARTLGALGFAALAAALWATPAEAQEAPAPESPAAEQPAPAATLAPPPPAVAEPAPAPAPAPAPKGHKLALKGPAPTVIVALESSDPGTRDQVEKVTSELRAALQRDGRLLPVQVGGEAASAAPAPNAEMKNHLQAAQDAYSGLDLDTATREYAEAIRAAFTQPESADAQAVAETFLALGAAYQLNGDKPHADGAYRFALALRPELQPDAKLYGPDIRKAFEAQRSALAAGAQANPASISVEVEGPPAAEVTVDGNPAGPAPVRGLKLFPGRHLVVARAAGYKPLAQVVAATPGQQTSAKLTLEEDAAHVALAGAQGRALAERNLPAPGPGITELAQKTSAQLVAVGTLSSSAESTRIELTLFDARTNRRLAGVTREAIVESARFPEVMDGLALELGNDFVEPPENALAEAPGGSRPIYRRWYFWAGVGAAVVAGATVAYVAGQDSGAHLGPGASGALGIP